MTLGALQYIQPFLVALSLVQKWGLHFAKRETVEQDMYQSFMSNLLKKLK